MANTTLSSIVLNGSYLSGVSSISSNSARKEAILSPMPLYLNDSNDTDVFDFGGVIKTVTLIGTYVNESGVSSLKTFIDNVEDLIQGAQDVTNGYPLTFVDDLRGTLKVKVMDFESDYVGADVSKVSWTLKIIESSENS